MNFTANQIFNYFGTENHYFPAISAGFALALTFVEILKLDPSVNKSEIGKSARRVGVMALTVGTLFSAYCFSATDSTAEISVVPGI